VSLSGLPGANGDQLYHGGQTGLKNFLQKKLILAPNLPARGDQVYS